MTPNIPISVLSYRTYLAIVGSIVFREWRCELYLSSTAPDVVPHDVIGVGYSEFWQTDIELEYRDSIKKSIVGDGNGV